MNILKKIRNAFFCGLFFMTVIIFFGFAFLKIFDVIIKLALIKNVYQFVIQYISSLKFSAYLLMIILYLVDLVLLVSAITIVGVIVNNLLISNRNKYVDILFYEIPFTKGIYVIIRRYFLIFFNRNIYRKKIVLCEYPAKGIYSIGLLSEKNVKKLKRIEKKVVFIPTSPHIMTGKDIVIDPKKIIRTNISVRKAMKYLMTYGMIFDQNGGRI